MIVQSNLAPADRAIRLTPDDPEAHYIRGLALVNLQRLSEAVSEFRVANQLRPHHYYQWLDLGVTLERLGNQTEAVAAFNESIRLAPSFAQPHWQLGNFLFREERYPEAFEELRLGVKSNPNLAEAVLDLAWIAANGRVDSFEALVHPASGQSHFEVARFLAKQGKGSDSAKQIREAGFPQTEDDLKLVRQTISALVNAGSFDEAFSVWIITHPGFGSGKGQILNGDFVESILSDDPGFGWQVPNTPNVSVLIDPSGPSPTTSSLRIEFSGDNPPANQVVNQLILAAPGRSYSLNFMAKAEKLITGGPPVIVALDAGSNPRKILGQSKPLSPGSSNWEPYVVDFSTNDTSSGVVIGLQRLQCRENPCPVFGKLWLGHFSLKKIG